MKDKPAPTMKKDVQAKAERRRIKALVKESTRIMMRKNEERGNAAQDVGLLGLFLEIRTMYLRLRNLVWDTELEKIENPFVFDADKRAKWKKDVRNALQDLRNYTVLAEIAMLDDNFIGVDKDEYLSGKHSEAREDT